MASAASRFSRRNLRSASFTRDPCTPEPEKQGECRGAGQDGHGTAMASADQGESLI